MKELAILLILLISLLFISGCADKIQESSVKYQNTFNNSTDQQNIFNNSTDQQSTLNNSTNQEGAFSNSSNQQIRSNNSINQQNINNNSAIQKSLENNSTSQKNNQSDSTNQTSRQNNTSSHQSLQNKNTVLKETKLKQINASLQKGPVFLEFGAVTCGDCQKMKPIIAQIAADYRNEITVISIDIGENPKLAEYFGVRVVPVSFVITGIKSSNYSYMQENGNVSMNGSEARIVGLKDKEVFEKTLDTALQQRKTSANTILVRKN